MKKIQYWLYGLIFLALSFPVKAFGMPTKYGSMQTLYGVVPLYEADPWYLVMGRWLLFPILPIVIILLIIIFIIKRARKKK